MAKRIFILVVAFSLVFIFPPPSHASPQPLFGPQKHIRTTGPPNTYIDTFQACNTGATYNLVLENGETGKDKISSGSIKLNSTEIVQEKDFNQNVSRIERTITLQKENTLNIKLASGPNGFIKISIYCKTGCLELKINSPTSGTTINKTKTIIKGNLTNVYGETGVTLQGAGVMGQGSVLAETQGNNFAGIIPLQQGTNTITATAADACGYKTTDTITINTETIQENIRLTAIPVQGQYQQTGLYFPKITITDTKGNTYTETTIVNVLSKEEMDSLLKNKWEGMKGGLVSNNAERAIAYLSEGSKEKYREIFNLLNNELSSIAAEMQEIELLYIIGNTAKYRIKRNQIINDQPETITYYIYFMRDENGLWKIVSF
ncbi:MAG: hypothetical protein HZB79_07615 [Deltaproteobacteria bacterium]|nr:hypothetical protein [Deltaproteobacteria bacterium]